MTTRIENGINGYATTWTYDCANAKGKQCSTTTTIDGKRYDRHTLYNPEGQISYVGYPHAEFIGAAGAAIVQGQSLRYAYNAQGFMSQAIDGADNSVYMQVLGRYRDGSLARAVQAGLWLERDFDLMGRTTRNQLNDASGVALQRGNYAFDTLGNVTTRAEAAQGWSEAFCYDTLNRVSSASGCGQTQFTYSADGNLQTKQGATGGIGTINYGNSGRPNGAGPHAVASATIGGQSRIYQYDNNGNLFNDGVRTLSYTPFNLPVAINGSNPSITAIGSANSLSYDYDGDHARVKEVATSGAGTTTTVYVGSGFFERVVNPDGSVDFKHYLSGPDGTLGVLTRRATSASTSTTTTTSTRHWYKDHLGSPVAEFDVGTTSTSQMTPLGYDTWGLRRKNTGGSGFTASLSAADLDSYASSRGYTGHQHMDEVGYIHMNGRIYDPLLGRFLQPDPIVQEPYNSQNFNRYSYVLNNPLVYTDPTGYSTWTEIRRPVGAIAAAIATANIVGPWATAYISQAGPPTLASIQAANAFTAAASGFAAGGVGGGNIQSAIQGAFSALTFFGAGELGFASGSWQNIAAHAAAGCINAGVQGGNCRQGAIAAGFAEFAGPRLLTGKEAADTAIHAMLGGAGAALAGGKFGNGAMTGAFGYLFNDMMHSRDTKVTLVGRYAAGIGEDLCSPSCLHLAVVISDNYYGVSLLDGQPNVGLTGVKLGPRQVSEFQKNTVFSIDLQPPEGQSARQFAEQLKFNATVLSPRGVPYTIPNLPSGYLAPGQFNSNSFASGLLQSVYGYVPNVSFGRNQAPGWSNPLPKKYFGGGG